MKIDSKTKKYGQADLERLRFDGETKIVMTEEYVISDNVDPKDLVRGSTELIDERLISIRRIMYYSPENDLYFWNTGNKDTGRYGYYIGDDRPYSDKYDIAKRNAVWFIEYRFGNGEKTETDYENHDIRQYIHDNFDNWWYLLDNLKHVRYERDHTTIL